MATSAVTSRDDASDRFVRSGTTGDHANLVEFTRQHVRDGTVMESGRIKTASEDGDSHGADSGGEEARRQTEPVSAFGKTRGGMSQLLLKYPLNSGKARQVLS